MALQLPIVAQGSVSTGNLPACTVGPTYGQEGFQYVSQVIISTGATAATITVNSTAAFVIPTNTVISLPVYPTGTDGGHTNNIDPTTWHTSTAVTVAYVVAG